MRLIDADEAVKIIKRYDDRGIALDEVTRVTDGIAREIEAMPTVDAVEVVRCKDCKHKHINSFAKESMIVYCIHHGMSKQPDDFCSYGEREDGE